MAEYKALIQGLKKVIDLKVKCLEVFGDSKIIVKQVKNCIDYLFPHIKGYQQEVWRLINYFYEFNITSSPHSQNTSFATLGNETSKFTPFKQQIYY